MKLYSDKKEYIQYKNETIVFRRKMAKQFIFLTNKTQE